MTPVQVTVTIAPGPHNITDADDFADFIQSIVNDKVHATIANSITVTPS